MVGLEKNVMSFAIKGALRTVKASKNILSPILEALINSIEAEVKKIKIIIEYNNLTKDNINIRILDDGNGFDSSDEKRYGRFQVLFTDKKQKNNKGCGRLQFLHFFEECIIKSKINNLYFKFSQDSNNENGIDDINGKLEIEDDFNTEVMLKKIKLKHKEEFLSKISNLNDLKEEILSLNFHKFILLENKMPKIEIKFAENTINITKDDIVYDKTTDKILVEKIKLKQNENNKLEYIPTGNNEQFVISKYKLSKDKFKYNAIYLCAKDLAVQNIVNSLEIGKNTIFNDNQNRYICFISSNILEINVNDARDGFEIPRKKDLKLEQENLFNNNIDNEFVCFDDILKKIKDNFTDLHQELKQKKDARDKLITEIAQELNLTQEQTKQVLSSTDIKYMATKNDIVEKCGEIKGIDSNKRQELIIQKYKDFNLEQNSIEDRNKIANNILELVTEQNKNDLSQYVIRRAIEIEILNKYIEGKLIEECFHNLIFPKHTNSLTNKNHNMWMINEDFANYDYITSETRLKDIKYKDNFIFENDIEDEDVLKRCGIKNENIGIKRPDIVIFHELGSIIIIDFKKPEIECFDYVPQIQKYATLMLSKAKKINNKSVFNVFFSYIVGENFGVRSDVEFKMTPDSEGYFKNTRVEDIADDKNSAGLYIEIQKYSRLQKLAKLRNNNFANKLNIDVETIMNKLTTKSS